MENKATGDSKLNVSPGSVTVDRKLVMVMKSEDIVWLYFIGHDGNLFYKDCYNRNSMLMRCTVIHTSPCNKGKGKSVIAVYYYEGCTGVFS